MSQVEMLEQTVKQLSPGEPAAFRSSFIEYDAAAGPQGLRRFLTCHPGARFANRFAPFTPSRSMIHFFLSALIAAWAAVRRAIGTRNGEQLT